MPGGTMQVAICQIIFLCVEASAARLSPILILYPSVPFPPTRLDFPLHPSMSGAQLYLNGAPEVPRFPLAFSTVDNTQSPKNTSVSAIDLQLDGFGQEAWNPEMGFGSVPRSVPLLEVQTHQSQSQ
jgi:hypothetical protein